MKFFFIFNIVERVKQNRIFFLAYENQKQTSTVIKKVTI